MVAVFVSVFFFFFLDCEVEEDGSFFVWDMVRNVEEGPMSEMDCGTKQLCCLGSLMKC